MSCNLLELPSFSNSILLIVFGYWMFAMVERSDLLKEIIVGVRIRFGIDD